MESGSDSDAPEEFTAEQSIKQDEKIRKVQNESLLRVAREKKERQRRWAQRKTQLLGHEGVNSSKQVKPLLETKTEEKALPEDIVNLLLAHEKKVFSDSEEVVINEQPPSKTKRKKTSSRFEAVILKDIPPPQCLQNSKDFLMKRKMQVSRSPSTLNNANQALRLVSSRGGLHS
ncbi:hypothetical protein QJS10_CPB15g01778 [Acorus calamus]|uniref:Uncharacterized protein n=1 Tax=Acorus calamus TaxID=4465 RepID=A0AAV9D4U6_ACOCL|nr:hypothetical protein QJS10_CPB15g01778 [Acorus calamus]